MFPHKTVLGLGCKMMLLFGHSNIYQRKQELNPSSIRKSELAAGGAPYRMSPSLFLKTLPAKRVLRIQKKKRVKKAKLLLRGQESGSKNLHLFSVSELPHK